MTLFALFFPASGYIEPPPNTAKQGKAQNDKSTLFTPPQSPPTRCFLRWMKSHDSFHRIASESYRRNFESLAFVGGRISPPKNRDWRPRNCSDFRVKRKQWLHCDLRVRWKVASDLRFRAVISEAKPPSFCGISGDLAPSTWKSLAIVIVRFWCAKAIHLFQLFRGFGASSRLADPQP